MSDYRVARTVAIVGVGIVLCALALAVGPRAPAARAVPGLQAATPALLVSECMEVAVGDQFELAIQASGASSLLAWEVYFAYNRHLLEVISRDVHQLLNTGRSPNVVDVSDPVPNSTGFYRIGAADLGPGDTPKEGDVLVRLTLQAKSEGVSPSTIYRGDYNGDGTIDYGPTLTAPGPQYLGDRDGDQRFDGSITSGQIAIGKSCVQPPPVLQPGDSEVVPETGSDDPGPGSEENNPPAEDGNPGDDPGGNENGDQQDTQASPAVNDSNQNTSSGGRGSGDSRNPEQPKEGGLGGGILAWVLVGLGVAAAGAGGITFYLMRMASREPY